MAKIKYEKQQLSPRINGHPQIIKEWEDLIIHYMNNPIDEAEIQGWIDAGLEPNMLIDTKGMPNDEWLRLRKHGVGHEDPSRKDFLPFVFGGSSSSAITGLTSDQSASPWQTSRDYFYEKTGREFPNKGKENTMAFAVGHAYEDAVASMVPLHEGYEEAEIYENTYFMQHPVLPFICINIDNMAHFKGEEHLVEVKTTSWRNRDAIELYKVGLIPPNYEMQERLYMSVLMQVQKALLICHWGFYPTEGAVIESERNLEVEAHILNAMVAFAYKIMYDIEPDYSNTSDAELIAESLARITGPMVPDTLVEIEDDKLFEYALAMEKYTKIKKEENSRNRQAVKDLDKLLTNYSNPILQQMKDNETLLIKGSKYPGKVLEFKKISKKSISVVRKELEKYVKEEKPELRDRFFTEKERESLVFKGLEEDDY